MFLRAIALCLLAGALFPACGVSYQTAKYQPCPNCIQKMTLSSGMSCGSVVMVFDEKGDLKQTLDGHCNTMAGIWGSTANAAIISGGIAAGAARLP